MSVPLAFRSGTVDKQTTVHRESRKRHFSEVSGLGIPSKPASPSRERKRRRLSVERRPRRQPVRRLKRRRLSVERRPSRQPVQTLSRRGTKRSFSEMTREEHMGCPQEMFPPPKRRRLDTGEATSLDTKESVTERKVSHNKIWIIGSSYIHRGEKAALDCFGQNFGLNAKVEWFGKGGLRWSGVLPRFYSALSTQSPPDILVLHAGGNDLGLVPAEKLGVEMKRGLMQLHKDFPSMRILFSCINERQAWRYGEPRVINGDRRIVNELMTRAVHCFGGEVVQHPLLRFFKDKLYLSDGVHFTQEGNHIFLSGIHEVLRKMLL